MPCVRPPCLGMLRNAGKHLALCLWQDLVKLKTSVGFDGVVGGRGHDI